MKYNFAEIDVAFRDGEPDKLAGKTYAHNFSNDKMFENLQDCNLRMVGINLNHKVQEITEKNKAVSEEKDLSDIAKTKKIQENNKIMECTKLHFSLFLKLQEARKTAQFQNDYATELVRSNMTAGHIERRT